MLQTDDPLLVGKDHIRFSWGRGMYPLGLTAANLPTYKHFDIPQRLEIHTHDFYLVLL